MDFPGESPATLPISCNLRLKYRNSGQHVLTCNSLNMLSRRSERVQGRLTRVHLRQEAAVDPPGRDLRRVLLALPALATARFLENIQLAVQ